MADTGRITLNQVDIIEVDADPAVSPGIVAATGSIALLQTSITGTVTGIWQKIGPADTDWSSVSYKSNPGLTFNRSGIVPPNSYLLNELTPSNVVGGVAGVTGNIIAAMISVENSVTATFTIKRRSGATLTTIGSAAITSARVAVVPLSIAVSSADELAVVATSGSPKNPKVVLLVTGN